MKKMLLLLVSLTGIFQLSAQTTISALTIKPEHPKQNSKVSFSYNQNYAALIKKPGVDIVVYQFTSNGLKVTEPVILKKGTIYAGSFTVDSNTACIAFGFSSGEEKDNNGGKGYVVPVYNKEDKPVQAYYVWANSLQSGYGEYLLSINSDAAKGLEYLEEGIQQYPVLKSDPAFLGTYLSTINSVKKKEAPELVLKELQDFESKGKLSEAGYNTLVQWYTRIKRKEKSDSLTTAMKNAFPDGDWKKNEAATSFNKEKDPVKKRALYQDFVSKYGSTVANKAMIDNMKSQMAAAYATAKDYTSYNEFSKELSKATIASSNNNIAWKMAEADENLEEAKKMASVAVMYAKNEMVKPSQKIPDGITKKQWEQQRKGSYAMYGDTYAFILYKLGDYKTAYPIAKDAAGINKFKDPDYNERYALLAEKALPAKQAKLIIEQLVKDGVATAKTKEALKNLYVIEKKSDKGYDDYLANLEAAAKNKKREEIAKTIINEPSPKFNLKDFEGKAVSLDDLKGKTIIVDFWATWCGPCIASMPGMNKTLTKYKDNENVKFLFVDTWETVENKLQNAKDFMTNKNYPFYVLMDYDNKMVEDFKVSGIPTKFVIDKEGKIRFKAIGFNGNDDELVDELTTMIELAGK